MNGRRFAQCRVNVQSSKIGLFYIEVDKVRSLFKVGYGIITKYKDVSTCTTGQDVKPLSSVKGVVTCTTSQSVISLSSDNRVVTSITLDAIHSIGASQNIVAIGAFNFVDKEIL